MNEFFLTKHLFDTIQSFCNFILRGDCSLQYTSLSTPQLNGLNGRNISLALHVVFCGLSRRMNKIFVVNYCHSQNMSRPTIF